MSYLSRREYEKRLEIIQRDNISTARKQSLRKERNKYRHRLKLPPTSKLLLWAAVLLCAEIIRFCEDVFKRTGDTSFIYVLAGVPATLVPTILGYYYKSKCENTAGGIVYEAAMSQIETGGGEEAVG